MEKIIYDVLNKLEENGYEAYIVGGYVRDFLLGKKSKDIDIITNALPKELTNIFNNLNIRDEMYGSTRIKQDDYTFDITTYREEIKYSDRKPKVLYINDLKIDLLRRDFTMNSICMNSNEEIIDLLNGREDISSRTIRFIGDIDKKLIEDPLRILRAIRFSTTLDFNIDETLIKGIIRNKDYLKSLSYTRKRLELDLILMSSNFKKGLDLIESLDLKEPLDIEFNEIVYSNDLLGMWSQISVGNSYNFSKEELKNLNIIKDIVSKKVIDKYTLYINGLYLSMVAGNILGYKNKYINELYNSLPIKSNKDIDIKGNEIISILNINPSKIINNVIIDIEKEILSGNLINNNEEIKNYIVSKKEVYLDASE